ncbi:CoA-binding protein [Nitrospira sp. Nam74]
MSETEDCGWRNNLIEDLEGVRQVLAATKRIAVLGIRSEQHRPRPAFYVPEYLASAGLQVIPVPVYDLHVEEILGQKVCSRLMDIPGELDLVDVFRRSEDIPSHLDDMLAKRPRVVWFQSGIRNDEVAETLARAGIKVVQDRCLMVDHRRYCADQSHVREARRTDQQ